MSAFAQAAQTRTKETKDGRFMMTVSVPSAATWTTSPRLLMRLPPYQPGPPLPLTGASLWPFATGGGGGTQEASSSASSSTTSRMSASGRRRLGRSLVVLVVEGAREGTSETVECEGRLNGSEKARFVRSGSAIGGGGVGRESERRWRSERFWWEMTSGRVGGRVKVSREEAAEVVSWVAVETEAMHGCRTTLTSVSVLRMPASEGEKAAGTTGVDDEEDEATGSLGELNVEIGRR
jgi:hypothetical protein